MKIIVAAIGRAKAGPERELFQSYLARLPWAIELKEIEIKKGLDTSTRRAREGYALLNLCPPQARIVALDERGKAETSATFATRIGRWRDGGARAIVFLIGGADGLDDNIRSRADAILSFGSMTWPHMLVRPLLAEQLYRAHSILSGHPYHRA